MTSPPTSPLPTEAPPAVLETVTEIAAPAERVFDALTDPEELAAWWADEGNDVIRCDSDPCPGGRWRITTVDAEGGERSVAGEYRVVDAPRHLETTWREEDVDSIVRYDLEPLGPDRTRLTVTHTLTAVLEARIAAGWRARLQRLTQATDVLRRDSSLAVHRYPPIWSRTHRRAVRSVRI